MQRGSYLASFFIMIIFVSQTEILIIFFLLALVGSDSNEMNPRHVIYIFIFTDHFDINAAEVFAPSDFRLYR